MSFNRAKPPWSAHHENKQQSMFDADVEEHQNTKKMELLTDGTRSLNISVCRHQVTLEDLT